MQEASRSLVLVFRLTGIPESRTHRVGKLPAFVHYAYSILSTLSSSRRERTQSSIPYVSSHVCLSGPRHVLPPVSSVGLLPCHSSKGDSGSAMHAMWCCRALQLSSPQVYYHHIPSSPVRVAKNSWTFSGESMDGWDRKKVGR